MKPTRFWDVFALFVVAVAVGWGLVSVFYSSLPPIPAYAGASLYPVAALETVIAFLIRSRIAEDQIGAGSSRLHPILVARALALAKASALVGAASAGVWLGFGLWVFPQHDRVRAAASDSTGVVIGLIAAVLLVAAALWLEHCCKTPGEPPEESATGMENPA